MGLPVNPSVTAANRDIYGATRPTSHRTHYASAPFTPAASPTDILAIISTGYDRIIRVEKIVISGTADTAAGVDLLLQLATHNNTGTSVALTNTGAGMGLRPVGANASTYPSSQSQALTYTANKSSNGNGISGTRPAIAARRMVFGTPTAAGTRAVFEWAPGFGPEIRDLITSVVVNAGGVAISAANAKFTIEEVILTEQRLVRVSAAADSLFAAAGTLWSKLNEAGMLAQIAALDNLSTAGTRLLDYLDGTNGNLFPQSQVVPARARDVLILGSGLNDARTGATQAQLISRLETAVQTAYVANPKCKIILCGPNAPTTDDPTSGGFIPLTGQYAGLTLAQAAQLCADICFNAYESFRGDPRIFAVHQRQETLGRTVTTVANSGASLGLPAAVMADQLHPNALGQEMVSAAFRPVLMAAIVARYAEINT